MKIWPMFCKACGQGIDRGDKYCRNCGVPLPQEPIETAVAASSAAAATGDAPIAIASSTAELQRPLPIPKALLTEVASAAAVEEKPAVVVTAAAIPAVPPVSDAGNTASPDPARDAVRSTSPDTKPQIADTPSPSASQEQKRSQQSEAPAEKPSAASAPDLKPADTPKPQAERVAVAQAASPLETSPTTTRETAKPDTVPADAGARPVRLCPQCHRLVGDDDLYCERCKAKLDQPARPQPAAAPAAASVENYGVPTFAGYAADPAPSKAFDDRSDEPRLSDPSGVDAISNLRVRRRRGLSVVEIVVAAILLAGAGAAVWMLRSSLPAKTSAPALTVGVAISPARARVVAGHAYDLAATVTGTDNYNVDWTIDEGDSGGRIVPRGAKAKDGAVSSLAVYMAPKTPGTYHVAATSKADPAKSASAIITVTGK
jgi:hypothetical protein